MNKKRNADPSSGAGRAPDHAPDHAPRIAVIAAAVVWAEAAVLIAMATLDVTHVAPERLALGLAGSVILGCYGAVLAMAAWKFLHWREWTRGLLVFTQLVALGLAWNVRDADPRWLAPVLAIAAGIILGCVLSPPVTRAFAASERE